MSVSETVPEGYKQTEIGVFPKDWQIKKFGDIFDFKSTASNSRSDLTETDEAHYIHYGDIHTIFHRHLDISKKSTPRIDLSLCKNASQIRNGDWVMADASEDFSGICKAIEISGIDEDKSVVAGLHTFLLRDRNEEYSPGFKGHLGEAKFLLDQYVRVSVGLKVFGVTKTSLRDLLIPVPPKTQQTKIEEILTEADAQIQSFEHLIANKKDIKQGTMQELLTGKTRLPGFTDEWETHKIGELVSVKTGDKDTQDRVQEGNYPFFVRSQKVERINSYSYNGEAILTAGDGVGTGKVFHYINGKFDYHQRVYCMSDFSKIYGRYFFYQFSTRFLERIMSMTAKSSVDSVRKAMITEMEIPVPVSINEQEAIAEVLSDMDAEIAALEERLEKAKAIKQGMMQQLLTGKIRLVD